MARMTINYKQFSNSKLATAVSFIGGLLASLIFLPGILVFAMSFLGLFTNGITNPESWATFGISILACLGCFAAYLVVQLVFNAIATAIAKAKLKKDLRKRGIEL